jgi:DNA-binding XRE family transcriptional regulator
MILAQERKEFGFNLKSKRIKKGISIADMAREINICRKTIYNLEEGKNVDLNTILMYNAYIDTHED